MFDNFVRNFQPDGKLPARGDKLPVGSKIPELEELLSIFGGVSFRRGLYRIIRPSEVADWNARVCVGFPKFSGRITCFGYDWQGSAFATDMGRLEQGQPSVVMFEPGTGKALQIPANIRMFHDVELVEDGDTVLLESIYKNWRGSGGAEPMYDQCIGYKLPLFLNGNDDFENQELSDLEVYWHIMSQLIGKTKYLPDGARVNVKKIV